MKKQIKCTLALAILPVLFSGQVSAEKGLAYDAAGSVWRTGSGECWTTSFRDKANQESGCFGEPEVEMAVKEGDADGDGVVDSLDNCPGTAAGVKVDAKGCPLDSDGDGVVDVDDKCPGTPSGIKVDAAGCELDSDGDGVADSQDKCPNTPNGATVTPDGCAVKIVLQNIQFELNSDRIGSDYSGVIERVAASLKSRSDIKAIEVVGYTDSSGAASYNQVLSEKRAKAVADALIAQGVDQGMISTKGMGEASPVADNKTSEGRAQNRRVELGLN
ncbi:MAG: OmpA family protein [Candidatus Thiodiazotropha sp. 6PLUC2]